jgi:hypothetical protein
VEEIKNVMRFLEKNDKKVGVWIDESVEIGWGIEVWLKGERFE